MRPAPQLAQLLPQVRKIAVLRANAVGDFVFALPALAALRAAYPDAMLRAPVATCLRDLDRQRCRSRAPAIDKG